MRLPSPSRWWRYWWHQNEAKLHDVKKRCVFGERLNDIVKIAGTRSVMDLRCYASALLDNDYMFLDTALDVVQFTLLRLQSQRRSRWRCEPGVPFEVAVGGRLEGELRALGIDTGERGLTRRLRAALLCHEARRHDGRRWSHMVQQGVTGVSETIRVLFDTADVDRTGALSETEFATAVLEHIGVDGLTLEEVRQVYRYIDADGSDSLTVEELAEAMDGLADPVLPARGAVGSAEAAAGKQEAGCAEVPGQVVDE